MPKHCHSYVLSFRIRKVIFQTSENQKDLGQFPIQFAQILTACG